MYIENEIASCDMGTRLSECEHAAGTRVEFNSVAMIRIGCVIGCVLLRDLMHGVRIAWRPRERDWNARAIAARLLGAALAAEACACECARPRLLERSFALPATWFPCAVARSADSKRQRDPELIQASAVRTRIALKPTCDDEIRLTRIGKAVSPRALVV